MIEKMMWLAVVITGIAVASMIRDQSNFDPQAEANERNGKCVASINQYHVTKEVYDLTLSFCKAGIIEPSKR